MDCFRIKQEEILNKMRQHVEQKSCCRSNQEYLDLNPAEPGVAYSDGYFIYQSDCPDAKQLNLSMRNLLADMKRSCQSCQKHSQEQEISLII